MQEFGIYDQGICFGKKSTVEALNHILIGNGNGRNKNTKEEDLNTAFVGIFSGSQGGIEILSSRILTLHWTPFWKPAVGHLGLAFFHSGWESFLKGYIYKSIENLILGHYLEA